MKEEKVYIKELGFTEQLLYGNDIKDNKIKELEEENRKLKKEKKTEWKRYYGVMLMIIYLLFFIFGYYAHSNIQEKQERQITKQGCIQFFESLSVR